jgi:2-polyprenyl-3-methyl-5-hydroxy-6-metoxy-1,4-benzoquinol methylase
MVLERIIRRLFAYASRAWERYEPPSIQSTKADELDGSSTSNYVFAAAFVNGKCVLDAGCGYGYGVDVLANRAKYVVGIDISSKAIRSARNRYDTPNTDFAIANCTNLPFKRGSFDVVVSFEVIEHLARQQAFLTEMKRVLKWDGRLTLSTPNKYVEFPHPFHVHEFAPRELRSLLQQFFPDITILGRSVKHVRKDRIRAEEQLSKSLRFRLALLLNHSSLKVMLLAFFIVPSKFRNALFGLRIPSLKACDFEFSEKKVEQAGTIIGIAENSHARAERKCPDVVCARSQT